MTEGSSQSIACPTNLCNTLVEDQMVFKLVLNPDVRIKYQVFVFSLCRVKTIGKVDLGNTCLILFDDVTFGFQKYPRKQNI